MGNIKNLFITSYLKTYLLDRVVSLRNVIESHQSRLMTKRDQVYTIREMRIVRARRNLWDHSIQ